MAGLTQIHGRWYATWRNAEGKLIKRATGLAVTDNVTPPKKIKDRARQRAQQMEEAATGRTPLARIQDTVRALAVANGMATNIPTLKAYLDSYPKTCRESTEYNRKRSFNVFMEFLGKKADLRIDAITPAICVEFVKWALKRTTAKTVNQYKTYMYSAFKRAVYLDDLLLKNPWEAVSVSKIAAALGYRDESTKRQPFTLEELYTLMNDFPAPWCDMVAASYYLTGLRISDVCLLRWDSINREENVVSLIEYKTGKARHIPLHNDLRKRLTRIRDLQAEKEPYVFPIMAHKYLSNQSGLISTEFTSLLKVKGIVSVPQTPLEGRRKHLCTKSFHSIRHSVVSILRSNALFSADVVRDAVGHDNEMIERGYFTGSMQGRKQAMDALATAFHALPVSPTLPMMGTLPLAS